MGLVGMTLIMRKRVGLSFWLCALDWAKNFEAVLDMMSDNKMDVKSLISHKFDVQQAKKAYELIGGLRIPWCLVITQRAFKKYDRSVKISQIH